MKLYSISDNYIKYLRKYDEKVYDNKEDVRKATRKYLGVVLKVNNFNYYIPTQITRSTLQEFINKIYVNKSFSKNFLFKNNHCVYYAFLTAYCTGLRVAKVFALTWDDIDFENRVIKVRHIVYDKPKDDKGRWYIGTTKTKQGTRQINMCETIYSALLNYKKKQQYMKKLYGKEYCTYHFEDVLNKYGKVVEQRIVKNIGNILQINKADMVFAY